ncbi:hypothetical protein [Winogradskyella sp. R77965]|uniref:hypothetical protein n=1 Tax=Winogradskyella sp. R77965 TaxID=3093872 RepID=UPI0037DC37C4
MSDFVIRKKEERMSEAKTVSLVKSTRKELSVFFKIVLVIAGFSGLVLMSLSNDNLMLEEILLSGGILSIVFLIHIISNR